MQRFAGEAARHGWMLVSVGLLSMGAFRAVGVAGDLGEGVLHAVYASALTLLMCQILGGGFLILLWRTCVALLATGWSREGWSHRAIPRQTWMRAAAALTLETVLVTAGLCALYALMRSELEAMLQPLVVLFLVIQLMAAALVLWLALGMVAIGIAQSPEQASVRSSKLVAK